VIVKQIWTANAYRNFNYLIVCAETGEAMAVDPLDSAKCLAAAKDNGWTITQVLNTHEHGDHTGGNRAVIAAIVKVGRTVELETLDTPGHTMTHVCLLSHTDTPALFCGDTLFNAGAGNCHNGGHPSELYQTFAGQLAKLPGETQVYPGHDYIENNLRFTLDREPDNARASAMLKQVGGQNPDKAYVSTLAVEKEVNSFFRLHSPSLIARLREAFPDLPDQPDEKTVFLKLRELRNSW
jgi:hydroxyacylglutathione hydrolase